MIIWLASYPKSGNTYVRAFLSAYYFSESGEFDFSQIAKIDQFPHEKFFKEKANNIYEASKQWVPIQKEINNVISTQDIFDTELLIRIEKSGYKILEVPAKVNEIRPSVSLIFTRIPRTLKSIFLLRFQLFKESLNTNNL